MKINFEEMIEKANTNEELDYIYKLTNDKQYDTIKYYSWSNSHYYYISTKK